MTVSDRARDSGRDPDSNEAPFNVAPFTVRENLDPIVTAWAAAFVEPPNGPRQAIELRHQLLRHSRYDGFRGFVARDRASGQVLGVIYGYSNAQGQWWRDQVARSMGPGRVALLDDSYCLTELGVIATARRLGVARALVATLLTSQPHPRALLSTRADNYDGLAFYRRTGWQVVLPTMSFGWNFPPYSILMHDAVPAVIGHTAASEG